jgi:hypothetical protein
MKPHSLILSAALLAAPCLAGATTLNFTGTVVGGLGSIMSGDTLTGTITYDETAAPALVLNPNQAVFNAITSMSFSVGGFNATYAGGAGGPEIQIDDFAAGPPDIFAVETSTADGTLSPTVLDGVFTLTDFIFSISDSTNTVFNTAMTLPSSVDFSDFDQGLFFVFFENPEDGLFAFDGTIEMVTTVTTPVPLPAAGLLALGGLALFGFAARRRRP